MQTKRLTSGLKIALALACLALVFALGYLTGMREAHLESSAPPLTRDLTIVLFGQTLHLRLSLSVLGVTIIFVLTILLAAAILFARAAQRRRRQVEAVNLELMTEISERKRAQDEVIQLMRSWNSGWRRAPRSSRQPIRNLKPSAPPFPTICALRFAPSMALAMRF